MSTDGVEEAPGIEAEQQQLARFIARFTPELEALAHAGRIDRTHPT